MSEIPNFTTDNELAEALLSRRPNSIDPSVGLRAWEEYANLTTNLCYGRHEALRNLAFATADLVLAARSVTTGPYAANLATKRQAVEARLLQAQKVMLTYDD